MWYEWDIDHEKKFTWSLMLMPHFDVRFASVAEKKKCKTQSIVFWITRTKTGETFGFRTQSNAIERKSNVNRTIKFDFVWSSNEIELTKNECKSNQIERSIKSVDVRFSSGAERHLSERLTSSYDMIWIERMFGFLSFYYDGDKCPGKCVNRFSHLKLCFVYFHTYFSFRPDIHRVCQHFPGICYPGFHHRNEFHEFCKLTVAAWIKSWAY